MLVEVRKGKRILAQLLLFDGNLSEYDIVLRHGNGEFRLIDVAKYMESDIVK